MRIALLGPPGSGKGTQAAQISRDFSLVHLSSGDILRLEKSRGSEAGVRIASFIDQGLLVPDEPMIEVMRAPILAAAAQGFVLDGFPRTLVQAEALDTILRDAHLPLTMVLNFQVDLDVIADRFAGRRICPVCRSVYHLVNKPPKAPGICDLDGATLISREDDQPAVVRRRIATYQQTMAPVAAFYEKAGALRNIDALQPIEKVNEQIEGLLGKRNKT
jgi:adenylate kinase